MHPAIEPSFWALSLNHLRLYRTGLFYATEVTLGGRLWNSHQIDSRDDERTAATSSKSSASAEVSVSVPMVASGAVKIAGESQTRSTQASALYQDEMATKLRAIGGSQFAATK